MYSTAFSPISQIAHSAFSTICWSCSASDFIRGSIALTPLILPKASIAANLTSLSESVSFCINGSIAIGLPIFPMALAAVILNSASGESRYFIKLPAEDFSPISPRASMAFRLRALSSLSRTARTYLLAFGDLILAKASMARVVNLGLKAFESLSIGSTAF